MGVTVVVRSAGGAVLVGNARGASAVASVCARMVGAAGGVVVALTRGASGLGAQATSKRHSQNNFDIFKFACVRGFCYNPVPMKNLANGFAFAGSALARSIIACLLGTFILRLAAAVMGNMLQLYFSHIDATEYPISFTLRSLATAIFFLPELLGSPILGSLSDRYGRKLFIMLGPISGAIAVQLTALTSHFGVLAFTRLLEGTSSASAIPATLGYLSAATSKDEALRGRTMGLFEIATIGGIMGGALIGGRLWDAFGRAAFTLNSIMYLVSLGIFFIGMAEIRNGIKRKVNLRDDIHGELHAAGAALRGMWGSIRQALTSASILRFVPAWLAINIILGAWLNNIIGALTEVSTRFPDQLLYGLLARMAGVGTQVSTYSGIVLGIFGLGILLWSFTFGRLRRTSVMLIGALGLFVLCAFLYAVNHAGSLSDPRVPFYLGGAVLALMIVSGFTPAALTYLADVSEDDPSDRGAIMGLYTVFFGIGQFFGTLVGGPFIDAWGMDGLILVTLLLGVAATYILIRLHSSEKQR